jgi:hypothetical protein
MTQKPDIALKGALSLPAGLTSLGRVADQAFAGRYSLDQVVIEQNESARWTARATDGRIALDVELPSPPRCSAFPARAVMAGFLSAAAGAHRVCVRLEDLRRLLDGVHAAVQMHAPLEREQADHDFDSADVRVELSFLDESHTMTISVRSLPIRGCIMPLKSEE